MLTLATSSTSPPAGAENDGALWIALGDSGISATHLRVTTNVVKEGRGRNKRERYVWVTPPELLGFCQKVIFRT